MPGYQTYALNAADLLEECLEQLDKLVIAATTRRYRKQQLRCLYEMQAVLQEVRIAVVEYVQDAINEENENLGVHFSLPGDGHTGSYPSLLQMASLLQDLQRQRRERNQQFHFQQGGNPQCHHSVSINKYNNAYISYPSLTTTMMPSGLSGAHSQITTTIDSLLFRLTVLLQLCLVRIDDARAVLTGKRLIRSTGTIQNKDSCINENDAISSTPQLLNFWITCGISLASGYLYSPKLSQSLWASWIGNIRAVTKTPTISQTSWSLQSLVVPTSAAVQISATALTLSWLHQKWSFAWMANKILGSINDICTWHQQWNILMNHSETSSNVKQKLQQQQQHQQTTHDVSISCERSEDNDSLTRTRQLIDHALHNPAKYSIWNSQGELRFLLLKHVMDILYASIGTAIDITGGKTNDTPSTIAAAAAASFYYSLTGSASRRSTEITSSAKSARELIQNAWGMVSLPSLKQLSLQASRLIKGAAVADHIEIAGVWCFVLSADPAPELAAAIAQSKSRQQQRNARRLSSSNQIIQKLTTIDETEYESDEDEDNDILISSSLSTIHTSAGKPFARCVRSSRQRDVILHLTGGGFFAHIIASDLPYLFDWSAATGAVVICPEYALLPQYTFPVALEQVEQVYKTLVGTRRNADLNSPEENFPPIKNVLGFDVHNFVLTGESAGGNLAAALCVKLGMENISKSSDESKPLSTFANSNTQLRQLDQKTTDSHTPIRKENIKQPSTPESSQSLSRMPDALMLSCPVLNLSLEMTHSRAVGSTDPVLPHGLIAAISDAYLPCDELGINKKYPLASPLFASDEILSHFPPTLMFASSTDPVLDDSVVFNQRLHYVGVASELFAAQNLPHAYLGLGTAGFPEAKQVQELCISWLKRQLGNCRVANIK